MQTRVGLPKSEAVTQVLKPPLVVSQECIVAGGWIRSRTAEILAKWYQPMNLMPASGLFK